MTAPKKHHYIPKWLMRFWANNDEKVIGIDRREKQNLRAFRQSISKVNSQNHLYSYTNANGDRDTRLETDFYQHLDNQASKFTKHLTKTYLEEGLIPTFSKEQRTFIWQFFLYNALKRHPEIFDIIGAQENYFEDIEGCKRYVMQAEGIHATEEEIETTIQALAKNPDFNQHINQKVRAYQGKEALDVMGKYGINIGHIESDTAFILPDMPFSILGEEKKLSVIWIPIHPKYAISIGQLDGKTRIYPLSKKRVRQVNEQLYERSKKVISCSEKQILSLARRIDGARKLKIL